MAKYLNRPAITAQQESEIFPLLDAALSLPFGKAVLHKCTASRADYLSRILNGERYRNAILSLSTYTPNEPLYGKGLYHHLVIEPCERGLLVANVEFPPKTLTGLIVECAATGQPVSIEGYRFNTAAARLNRLKERHPQELGHIYPDANTACFHYSLPKVEELVVVDVDTQDYVHSPTPEEAAKLKQ